LRQIGGESALFCQLQPVSTGHGESMKRPAFALVVFVALLGVAGSAKADTIGFSFISTPNSTGTYVDAFGTLTGNLTYLSDPADENLLMVDSGTITVVSNVPPTPFNPLGPIPRTPELNGSSNISFSNGGFVFSNSSAGVSVSDVGSFDCDVCFEMPGNPADGGDFTFAINPSGVNGAPGNSNIAASDGGTLDYFYTTGGTLTLYGQVGNYDLSPEPPSWLLLGSGIVLLAFLFYRRSVAV
jgi:hypothetical protein